MFRLPQDLITYIYSFDNTYNTVFNNVILELEDYFIDLAENDRDFYSN